MGHYEDLLKKVETEVKDLESAKDGKKEPELEKKVEKVKFGTRIAELASKIKDKYIDNDKYWTEVVDKHPTETAWF